MPSSVTPGEQKARELAEREACEKYGIPFCEIHQREKTGLPWGGFECESCGWEAQRVIDEGQA